MAANDETRARDPLEQGDDRSSRAETSGNREESMKESGKDAFGRAGAVRKPDSESQGDGSSDAGDASRAGRSGKQSPSSSGTESLGGETRDANDQRGAGGVEGGEN